MSISKDDVNAAKRQALETARSLRYPDDILVRLINSETVAEVDRIMTTARRNGIRKDDDIHDKEVLGSKPKPKPVTKKKASTGKHKFLCPNCGRECIDDYYLVTCVRIKEGVPYFTKFKTLWCSKCYNHIYEQTKELQRRSHV